MKRSSLLLSLLGASCFGSAELAEEEAVSESSVACIAVDCATTYWSEQQSASPFLKTAFHWDSLASLIDTRDTATTLTGAATLVADGPYNHLYYAYGTTDFSALSFAAPLGSAAYVTDTNALCRNGGDASGYANLPFTVSAFVLQSGAPQDGTWDTIAQADHLFSLALHSSSGAVRFGVWDEVSAAYSSFETPAGAFRANEWHRIRAVYDDSDETVSLYVDERLAGVGGAAMRLPSSRYNSGCHTLYLSDPVPAASFYGRITGVWAVRDAHHPVEGEARVRAELDMDGPFSSASNGLNQFNLLAINYPKAADKRVQFYAVPAALDAPVVDPTNPMSAVSTKVFSLSAQDRPTATNTSMLRYLTQATYEAWIHRSVDSGAAETILSNGNFSMQILASDKLQCRFNDTVAPTTKPVAVSRTAILTNAWHRVACSFDGRVTKVWIDGIEEASAALTTGTPGYYASGTGNLELGKNTASNTFIGKITGVRVWDRARPPQGGDCKSACTIASPPSTACYDVALQSASTCGDFGVDSAECAAVCSPDSACDTPCGYAAPSSCGAYVVGGAAVCNVEPLRAHSTTARLGLTAPSDAMLKLPPLPGYLSAELVMSGGRLNRVPVSYAWIGQVGQDVTGSGARGTAVVVRASCSVPNATKDVCDPGLVLVAVDPALDTASALRPSAAAVTQVKADNNVNGGPVAGDVYTDGSIGSGTTEQSAQVSITIPANVTRRVYAIVYSANRGTSKVDINWTTESPFIAPRFLSWQSFSGPFGGAHCTTGMQRNVIVGGTLVKVGTVIANEVFAVRTASNGANTNDKTQLVLFNPSKNKLFGTTSQRLQTAGASGAEFDPNFIFDASWQGETFALVGKESSSAFSPGVAYPETFVDLTHTLSTNGEQTYNPSGWPVEMNSPNLATLDRIHRNASYATNPESDDLLDTVGVSMAPGKYLISVRAIAAAAGSFFAVGEFPDVDGEQNFTAAAGTNHCNGDDGPTSRGQGNDLAFVMEVSSETAVYRRYVPRGVLGASGDWNRVTMNLEIPDGPSRTVKVSVRDLGAGIRVKGGWSVIRNADSVTLTTATQNLEYGHGVNLMQNASDVKNAIRLLGAGPRYVQSSREIRYLKNQGAWSFEADIIGMNEIHASSFNGNGFIDCDDSSAALDRPLTMFADLNNQTAGAFSLANGLGTTNNCKRANPIYLRSNAASSAGISNLSSSGVSDCSFSDYGGGLQCKFADGGPAGTGAGDYYFVVARAAAKARRSDGLIAEKPIAVLQFYLPPDDDDLSDRRNGRSNLIDQLKDLIQANPSAFNANGSGNAYDPGNRIIIQGDSNMSNSSCAESNAWLKFLREEFGYAVDASMAAVDAQNRTFDMHYGITPLSPWSAFSPKLVRMVDYSGFETGTIDQVEVSNHGPFRWSLYTQWNNDPFRSYATGIDHFPWWKGVSTVNGGGGRRLDVVFLVGLGWADDDPVQGYQTVTTAPEGARNPTNGFSDGSIDIRNWCSDTDLVAGAFPSESYLPDFLNVCTLSGGTAAQDARAANGAGALAYRSDHKPLMVRLRSLMLR